MASRIDPSPRIHLITWAGAAVALLAVLGEGIADAQLRGFKKNPANKGQVCRVGLWGWSRSGSVKVNVVALRVTGFGVKHAKSGVSRLFSRPVQQHSAAKCMHAANGGFSAR